MDHRRIGSRFPKRPHREGEDPQDAAGLLEGRDGGELLVQKVKHRRMERVGSAHLLQEGFQMEAPGQKGYAPLVEQSILLHGAAGFFPVDVFKKPLSEDGGEVLCLDGHHDGFASGQNRGQLTGGALLQRQGVGGIHRLAGELRKGFGKLGGLCGKCVMEPRQGDDEGEARMLRGVVQERHEERRKHGLGPRVGDGPSGCVMRQLVDEDQDPAAGEDAVEKGFVGGIEAIQIESRFVAEFGSAQLTGDLRPQRIRFQFGPPGLLDGNEIPGDGDNVDASRLRKEIFSDELRNIGSQLFSLFRKVKAGDEGVGLASAEAGFKPLQGRGGGIAAEAGNDIPKHELHLFGEVCPFRKERVRIRVDRVPGFLPLVEIGDLVQRGREDFQVDGSGKKVFSGLTRFQHAHGNSSPFVNMIPDARTCPF